MRYEMVSTEIDAELNKRIIKVHDHQENFTYIYYDDEIEDISIPGLKIFIKERIDPINIGVYDVPTL
ncbi:hypothetical protein GCM10011351_28440 [Paraliobacillus quinghaiensis]|uniref:Uncharacterized protein n=1 Tax=Paraliobacillus quinghaiensis TaxID=470815 RepID=A0A917WWX9_9BACI|nr:hypothetical protein [Paraliobacillus quinghaiensis]GGM40558.1 hypothetical protein GCM10011351_28440 [Paraliobacillus quinghaiensis]